MAKTNYDEIPDASELDSDDGINNDDSGEEVSFSDEFTNSLTEGNEGYSITDEGLVDKDGKVIKDLDTLTEEYTKFNDGGEGDEEEEEEEEEGDEGGDDDENDNPDDLGLSEDDDGNVVVNLASKHLKFNEEGDVIDKDGEVILPKKDYDAEIKKLETDGGGDSGNEDESVIADIQKRTGVEVLGEDGKPKTYENSDEGISQYVQDAIAQQGELSKREGAKALLEANPHLRAYAEHLNRGGDPRSFFEDVTKYDGVELKDDDNDQHLEIISANFQRMGSTKEKADNLAKLIVDKGDGKAEAVDALKALKDSEKAERQKALDAQEAVETQQRNEATKTLNEAKTIISSRKLAGGIEIPAEDVQPFMDYISKPIKDGKTQEVLDREAQPLDSILLEAFLGYKGGDVSKLAKIQAKKDRVTVIRNQSSKSAGGKTVVVNRTRPARKKKAAADNIPDVEDIINN